MKNKLIISAFPAVGKTYLYNKFKEMDYNVSDSDSSKFSKGADFLDNYLEHIRNLDSNLVLVSTHEQVVNGILDDPELNENYWIVVPNLGMKGQIIERMLNRGSLRPLIEVVEMNYFKWVHGLITSKSRKVKILRDGEYLSDIVLVDCNGKFKVIQ